MPNFEATGDLMSPLSLFLHADIVVKIVMLGLLAASVWTWAIIFTHSLRLRRINRATGAYRRRSGPPTTSMPSTPNAGRRSSPAPRS